MILALQRMARSHRPAEFKAAALSMLKEMIYFDAAMWGTAKFSNQSVTACDVYLYNQPSDVLTSFQRLGQEDVVTRRLAGKSGISQAYNSLSTFCPDQCTNLRQHCGRFNIHNILISAFSPPGSTQSNFLTLIRSQGTAPFSNEEVCRENEFATHLIESWLANTSWHIQCDSYSRSGRVAGICDASGYLVSTYPGLERHIRRERANWQSGRLPDDIMRALLKNSTYTGDLIDLSASPVGDMMIVSARSKNQGSNGRSADPLSVHEERIARAAATGLSYKEIARQFAIAPGTVRTHMHNIYQKLNIPKAKCEQQNCLGCYFSLIGVGCNRRGQGRWL